MEEPPCALATVFTTSRVGLICTTSALSPTMFMLDTQCHKPYGEAIENVGLETRKDEKGGALAELIGAGGILAAGRPPRSTTREAR